MGVMTDHFPVFEANQVLTSGHLNDVFDYLDERTRLTRSTLIGIGIVCGLQIRLDTAAGTAILLSKGCGVTSQGYLIVEPQDVSLVAYREYTLPPDLDYPLFEQFPLWELFPAGEANTTALDATAQFLDDKAVVLFLELKKQGLRNCSPNNCDDKGSQVTATVRRLLVKTTDLDQIIAAANAIGTGLTASDLDAALSAKLDLPDLRVQRFDVPASGPATANDVYAGLLNVFRAAKLAQATGAALSAAYAAFKPLLQAAWPTDPFADFSTTFGFLDKTPTSTVQVRFLQYYVDLFEDLLCAYDEFRWKGVALLCVCCPSDGLFPRHLMLGLLHPEAAGQPARYRQPFLPSPAVGDCVEETSELLLLFSRLVEMAARFSNTPALPKGGGDARIDPQIRITPSVLGNEPLGTKAIPYYYRQNGTPPLYRLWNWQKTRRDRANRNLGFRHDEYDPPPPAFVSDPLRYDLEPYNFLRIEGHLGKDYRDVMRTLLLLRSQYRLPVDVIAIRAGVYDPAQPVDSSQESARFQDLEALYDALREELLSSLAAGAMDLYDVPVAGSELPGGVPQLPLLKSYERDYRYPAGSVGAYYEARLQSLQAIPYIDVDQTLISDPAFSSQVLRVYCVLFAGSTGLPAANFAHVVCIFYFSKLAEILPASLDALAYADFANKYQDLLALVRYFRNEAARQVPADLESFVPQMELIDQFDQVLFDGKLEAIKSAHAEHVRRLDELRRRQFLANFLQQHPGIQHKAGVPQGGTFIVVYHGEVTRPLGPRDLSIVNTALFAEALTRQPRVAGRPAAAVDKLSIAELADAIQGADVKTLALTDAINRISSNRNLSQDPDVSLLLGSLTGRIPLLEGRIPARGLDEPATRIIAAAVNELSHGTVIADFYLPYRISGDVPGMQFVLPKEVPNLAAKASCTNPDGIASVTVDARGGESPYDIAVDEDAWKPLTTTTVSLSVGSHTLRIRDAAGTQSTAVAITIPRAIVLSEPQFACRDSKYTVTVTISGGTPPYTVGDQTIAENGAFTSAAVESGTSVSVEVVDSAGCSARGEFTHTCPPACTLPCSGIALRRGYRMWLPEADPNNPYEKYNLDDVVFSVESALGSSVDLSNAVRGVIKATAARLAAGVPFQKTVDGWCAQINQLVANEPTLNEAGKASWLTLSYESAGAGRLGILWIEYFECLNFDIRIASSFIRGRSSESLRQSYVPAGTTILVNDREVTVPASDGVRIDKCRPEEPIQELCPREPRVALEIAVTSRQGTTVELEVREAPRSREFQFFWEVQGATPPMGNGRKFTTTFPAGIPALVVVVTAFSKEGCSATQSTRIPVG
jgi:hypothetical protein